MAKKRQFIEKAKARSQGQTQAQMRARSRVLSRSKEQEMLMGTDHECLWQVPTLGVYYNNPPAAGVPCLNFEKGKPHGTVLDIVRKWGFQFDWGERVWHLPVNDAVTAHAAIREIKRYVELVEEHGESNALGTLAHEEMERANHKASMKAQQRTQIRRRDVSWRQRYHELDDPRSGSVPIEGTLTPAERAQVGHYAESEVVKMLEAKIGVLAAENNTLRAQLFEKEGHIKVLELEARGRSAVADAKPAKPAKRGPTLVCQNEEDVP